VENSYGSTLGLLPFLNIFAFNNRSAKIMEQLQSAVLNGRNGQTNLKRS
jgi:hypothetical protein